MFVGFWFSKLATYNLYKDGIDLTVAPVGHGIWAAIIPGTSYLSPTFSATGFRPWFLARECQAKALFEGLHERLGAERPAGSLVAPQDVDVLILLEKIITPIPPPTRCESPDKSSPIPFNPRHSRAGGNPGGREEEFLDSRLRGNDEGDAGMTDAFRGDSCKGERPFAPTCSLLACGEVYTGLSHSPFWIAALVSLVRNDGVALRCYSG